MIPHEALLHCDEFDTTTVFSDNGSRVFTLTEVGSLEGLVALGENDEDDQAHKHDEPLPSDHSVFEEFVCDDVDVETREEDDGAQDERPQ